MDTTLVEKLDRIIDLLENPVDLSEAEEELIEEPTYRFFMYHREQPKGKVFETPVSLVDDVRKELEKENWADTPVKLDEMPRSIPEKVMALHNKGVKPNEISKKLGLTFKTVTNAIKNGEK